MSSTLFRNFRQVVCGDADATVLQDVDLLASDGMISCCQLP